MKYKDFTVGLPCYNEEKNILHVLNSLIYFLKNNFNNWEILIVDNKSKDLTSYLVKNFIRKSIYKKRIRFIQNKSNIFYSGSVNKIIKYSRYNTVGVMDSDGQYNPNSFLNLYKKTLENFDLIIGRRKKRKDNFFRKYISYVFYLLSKFFIKNNLKDLNCGIRIIKKNYVIKNYIQHRLNFCNPELYVKYLRSNLNITDVVVIHRDRNFGKSIHNLYNIFKTLFIVTVYLFRLSLLKK
jgi:glycosyltransferase involved in cell wall biosynthesis